MRIAWFTHRYFPCLGGSETYGREIVRRLVAAGHDVDVLTSDAHDLWYFTDPRRKRTDAPREERVEGARVLRLPVRHFPGQKYVGRLLSYAPHWPTQCRWESYMPVIPALRRIRGPYDVVFGLGFPFTVFSYHALRVARASGCPLILTPFLHLATPGDAVNRHYTRPHQIRLLAEADLVVVQTEIERDAVIGWGIPAQRVRKLGMGVCHEAVTGGDGLEFRRRHGVSAGSRVVGYLGVSDLNKGTVDLVRAVERLNETRSGPDRIQVLLGGSSSPDFERFLSVLGEESRTWLRPLGSLTDQDVRHFYAALDVFAMPSRTDSFGIVFLEAWANGLPVIGARAGGIQDVVRHGETGWLVPFGDVGELAGAIERLTTDMSFATGLGHAGRIQVAKGHRWDDKFATLTSWMDALLDDASRSDRKHAKRVA